MNNKGRLPSTGSGGCDPCFFRARCEAEANHIVLRYPALIDAVVQSMGIGFVGTARSTMSLVAAKRVEDWNGGISRQVSAPPSELHPFLTLPRRTFAFQVSWGRNGADD